jgi:hypothetical protein
LSTLYSNENFPWPAVEHLRELGHDVLTTQDAGNAGQAIPDEEVLKFATQNGRSVVTINRRHFVALHKTNPEHAGIIVCSFDIDFKSLAVRIHKAVQGLDSLTNQLIRVNRLNA